ncbi:peptidoglycan-binding domain-containing protein [Terriglobus saanensis]|uniref:Peptidoglycan-binding domain 1 protein n=1 Tax=Terriglobus saanensis (strain ATCC BAA-1853 / DSM 23119 / SP1PR4) TaxID=401053 RepID=E8V7B1_TERSS|nr:peptidoglycan-binding domain-containing protein [Terriglobus saanensis]ADV82824.1 Peptidoglycan-binding domain 1 protein [Terriglobus saanensis SP1PR4]
MRPFTLTALFLLALISSTPSQAVRTRRGPTSGRASQRGTKASKHKAEAVSHPRAIEDARATQIQSALIKAGYMSGEPTGHWDSASETAMQKLQSDNGWQSKLVPDSRALIKLGLGPQTPQTTTASSAAPTAHIAQ